MVVWSGWTGLRVAEPGSSIVAGARRAAILIVPVLLLAAPSAPFGRRGDVWADEPSSLAAEEIGLQELIDQPIVADSPATPSWSIDNETGDVYQVFEGNVSWEFVHGREGWFLLCDRLAVVAPRLIARGEAADPHGVLFWFQAEGNVRLELRGREMLVRAASIFYERFRDGRATALLEGVSLRTTIENVRSLATVIELRDVRGTAPFASPTGAETIPFTLAAAWLETDDFRHFTGEDVHATTCDYEVPQFSIGGETADVAPVECDECSDFIVELGDARFELGGDTFLPLPLSRWDTRWNEYFPIRDVHLGHSGKFGFFGGVDWNLNFLLDQLPGTDAEPIRRVLDRSRLSYETTFFADRGFGHGPKGLYGTDPRSWLPWPLAQRELEWYGESRYFTIRDHGEDGSSRQPFGDPDRWWADVNHRQVIPYVGTLDVEYSERSDPNFLREYFEAIEKREKEQESLFYLRRNFADAIAATALYKYRSDDFETVVERTPEAKLLVLEQPLFETGIYTDLTAQAAYLAVRPADALGLASRRFGRLDAASQWSYPVHVLHPWLDLRPFALARYTWYDELLDPSAGDEDRLSLGAGITVSQEWSRAFDVSESVLDRWFDIERLKHVVVPSVTYVNRFTNDLDPTLTIGIDEVDTVDFVESVAVSLRQSILSRFRTDEPGAEYAPVLRNRPGELFVPEEEVRSLLDSEASIVFFPRSDRDNEGDLTSLLLLDNSVYPGRYWSLRAWIAANVEQGFRVDRTDVSTSVELVPGFFTVSVGDRFTRRPSLTREEAHFIYGLTDLRLGEKWRIQNYVAHDFGEGRTAELSVALVRMLPCRFGLVLEYSVDPGEDWNQSFSINFGPLGLLAGLKRGVIR